MKRVRLHHIVLVVGMMPFLISCSFYPWTTRTWQITPEKPLQATADVTEVRVVLDRGDRAYYAVPLADGRELQVYTSADQPFALIVDPATGKSIRLTVEEEAETPLFLRGQSRQRLERLHYPNAATQPQEVQP